MYRKADAVVAGHICLDIIPKMLASGYVMSDIFRPGKLINVEKAKVSSGGPVSNTGLALHRLGINVELMGKCGDDMFGQLLIQKIKEEVNGAEKGMQIVKGETTSYTVVVAPPGIDRIFLHCCGANDTFGADDIDIDTVKPARLFHFGYPPLMSKTYENDGDELVKIFTKAKATGVTTSLDMAFPDANSASGRVNWSEVLKKTLPNVDLFLPSAEELTFMLQRSIFDKLLSRAGNSDLLGQMNGDLLSALAEECLKMGAKIVVIKCGYLGVYIRTAGKDRLGQIGRAKPDDFDNWTNREIFEPSFKVDNVVSAAGSGDNAIAGFLAAYLRGCSIGKALRCLCAVGAQNVQVPDAVSGVKSWQQTCHQIEDGLSKNELSIPFKRWQYKESSHCYIGPHDSVI